MVLESRQPLIDVRALADWALERGLDLPDLDLRRPSLGLYRRLRARWRRSDEAAAVAPQVKRTEGTACWV
jgi:hypothetical protein